VAPRNEKPVRSRRRPTAAVQKRTAERKNGQAAANRRRRTPAESPAESKDEAAEKKEGSGLISRGQVAAILSSAPSCSTWGAGCRRGKCLADRQIALRGIVQIRGGMIGRSWQQLDKAYFLVRTDRAFFNGYVLKISVRLGRVQRDGSVQEKTGPLETRESSEDDYNSGGITARTGYTFLTVFGTRFLGTKNEETTRLRAGVGHEARCGKQLWPCS